MMVDQVMSTGGVSARGSPLIVSQYETRVWPSEKRSLHSSECMRVGRNETPRRCAGLVSWRRYQYTPVYGDI